jgi:hypothetical protein
MLFATTGFAFVLGLCAPFDSASIVIGIPISCLVFAFLLVVKEPQSTVDCRVYSSRRRAILAGVWQGALFGGKWMAIVASTFMLLLWTILTVGRWLRDGDLELLKKALYATFLAIAVSVSAAAIMGALIMGIARGATYRQRSAQSESREKTV